MMEYFDAFGEQIARLRSESGTVSAISGIFKAPMDIIADKLRGYLGLVEDLFERRDKVLAACEALMPHLYHVARTRADPQKFVPIGYWMHRGGVPFVSPEIFKNIYWATVKPIIEELWADGHQTLFYAEGKWDYHLESFAELPERSIVYHVDQGDIFKAHRCSASKFCLSGGIPNVLLAYGTPEEVRATARRSSRAWPATAATSWTPAPSCRTKAEWRTFGDDRCHAGIRRLCVGPFAVGLPTGGGGASARHEGAAGGSAGRKAAGVVVPWEQKRKELPPLTGDESLVRQGWEHIDGLANMYLWQVLLSF